MSETPTELAVKALWEATKAIVDAAIDASARSKYDRLLRAGATDVQRDRINLVYWWEDCRWAAYDTAKAQVLAGDLTAKIPPFDPCPYTFREIVPPTIIPPVSELTPDQQAVLARGAAASAARGMSKPPKV